MKIKKVLAVVAVLAGFSVPLQAQRSLPVEVICVKGQGTYQPICQHTKQAVGRSSEFRKAKSGNRYVVIVYAEKGQIDGGIIDMAVAYGAVLSDPLSKLFPYSIGGIPFVFAPSESRIWGEALIIGGLPVFVDAFSAVVNEINSYGTLQRELSEDTGNDIIEKMKFEIDKILREKTKK